MGASRRFFASVALRGFGFRVGKRKAGTVSASLASWPKRLPRRATEIG